MRAPGALASTTSEKTSEPCAASHSGPSSDTKGISSGNATGALAPGNEAAEVGWEAAIATGAAGRALVAQARAGARKRVQQKEGRRGRMRRHEITDRSAPTSFSVAIPV